MSVKRKADAFVLTARGVINSLSKRLSGGQIERLAGDEKPENKLLWHKIP